MILQTKHILLVLLNVTAVRGAPAKDDIDTDGGFDGNIRIQLREGISGKIGWEFPEGRRWIQGKEAYKPGKDQRLNANPPPGPMLAFEEGPRDFTIKTAYETARVNVKALATTYVCG